MNKDFGSIFSTLLPGANARLAPPEGCGVLDGLEFKVALGKTWKENLTELSGGQRSAFANSFAKSGITLFPKINNHFGYGSPSQHFLAIDPLEHTIVYWLLHISLYMFCPLTIWCFYACFRSLVALSLILAMLLFKPAPIYILDEVDAALDLSHTQNIGQMLRTHFTHSQVIHVIHFDICF